MANQQGQRTFGGFKLIALVLEFLYARQDAL